jgi:hypothetical protein
LFFLLVIPEGDLLLHLLFVVILSGAKNPCISLLSVLAFPKPATNEWVPHPCRNLTATWVGMYKLTQSAFAVVLALASEVGRGFSPGINSPEESGL